MADDRRQRAEQMRKEREKTEKRQRNVITIAIVFVVVALVAVGGYAISSTAKDNEPATELVPPRNATDDYGVLYDAAAAGATAPEDAEPVSVEVYEDFQCPICRQFEQSVAPALEQMVESGAITLTYKPFSFLDDTGGSPNGYSKRSTNVALCALDAGGVEDYKTVHDYLYANQPEEGTPGPENNELIDAVDGLGITGLESCVRKGTFVPWIEDALENGREDGVAGTPTVFVDGKKLERFDAQTIQAAIDAAQTS